MKNKKCCDKKCGKDCECSKDPKFKCKKCGCKADKSSQVCKPKKLI
jgi:hypothetical protein